MKRLIFRSPGLSVLLFGVLALTAGSLCGAQETPGFTAPALFNQANAFARAGKTGQAILTYERARLLAPDDADIAANEHAVRARSGLPDAPENRFERVFNFARPNSFAWLGCMGMVFAGASLLLMRLFQKRRGLLRASMIIGLMCMLFAASSGVFTWPKMSEAVVTAKEAPAHVSPVNVAESAFKLREGEIVTVRMRKALGFRARERLDRSRIGWVARADLARVVPQSN